MPPVANHKTYWRSLEDLADTPEFRQMVENEFPSRIDELVDPLSRRRFLKVMGASMALAGLTGCDVNLGYSPIWPKERILPFAKRPEGRHPGTPVHYATSLEQAGVSRPLLAKSYDGRPVKVEGNQDHPSCRGWSGTDSQSQASVLSLYDPDRSKHVMRSGADGLEQSSWEAFLAAWNENKPAGGLGLYVLAPASNSPSLSEVKKRLQKSMSGMLWLEHEPLAEDAAWAGTRQAFGDKTSYRTHLDLKRAKVVVTLDADLFMSHPAATTYAKAFMDGRRATGAASQLDMNRLYAAEGVLSVTGSQADHRLPVSPSRVPLVGLDLAAKLAAADETLFGAELNGQLAGAAEQLGDSYQGYEGQQATAWVSELVQDLLDHKGRSVIAVGPRQPAELHALAALLNEALGNVGKTVRYVEAPEPSRGRAHTRADDVVALKAAIDKGSVKALVILGCNPAYDAPADLGLAEALAKVPFTVHLGTHADETAQQSDWHLPQAHYLESWGDGCAWDGQLTLQQPLIAPIFGGRSPMELLALLSGSAPVTGYEIVRATMQAKLGLSGDAFEGSWRQALHDGYASVSLTKPASPAVRRADVVGSVVAWAPVDGRDDAPRKDSLELVLAQDHKLFDGRHANNAWLQETPDPITKMTWDNALLMSPFTAAALEIDPSTANEVELSAGPVKGMRVGVFIVPGMAPFTVALALGYGRKQAGVVAEGAGVDAYPFRTSDALHLRLEAKVAKTGGHYKLATTQDHHAVDTGLGRDEIQKRLKRPLGEHEAPESAWLLREATQSEYKANPTFAKIVVGPDPELTQMWGSPVDYAKVDYRWALSIDLNACTGCSACVTACVAENNIPVVGKQEVARGREMHWIRIDRYYKGDPEATQAQPDPWDPQEGSIKETVPPAPKLEVLQQPVPCMQCENAPCESVCPVAATVHSSEGLNDMVYNRCVGTRYCSNNCPYKVRRFNYFYNHYGPFHPRSEPRTEGLLADETPKFPETTPEHDSIEKMAFNPEVTVRSRGVMEKCTYCVQRIKAATIPAKNEGRKVKDGEIQTACQQACPTRAIVFGDMNDPQSEVSALHQHERTYSMLAELNARPRTRYMAKLRNPRAEASE